MTREQKLERWAEREIRRNIHTMIVNDESGGYVAFGRYHLRPAFQAFEVYTSGDNLIGTFSNKRTAISWCVADNHNQLRLAQSIKTLDTKKQTLSADIYCRQQMADRSRNNGFSEVVLTKLQPKVQQHTLVDQELEKCLISAKYIQLRGFQNETARTSGNQAN
jgi:hypothetical protein